MTEFNPLSQFYRQPAIAITLPSQGRWYSPGSIEIPPTGEIGIMPMTVADELVLKTPDALLNGEATVKLIQSCVPAIKNAWEVPAIDLDMILVAIRIATRGHEMETTITCPCERKNVETYKVDLRNFIDHYRNLTWNEDLTLSNGLKVCIKPINYQVQIQNFIKSWEQERIFRALDNPTLTDAQKMEIGKNSLEAMKKIQRNILVNSISSITLPTQELIDRRDWIESFIDNTEAKYVHEIEAAVEKNQAAYKTPDLPIACKFVEVLPPLESGEPNPAPGYTCSTVFKTPMEFDYSRFFG